MSRRTAERMRDAVEAAFGPLDRVDVDSGDRRIHWRLQSRALHPFIANPSRGGQSWRASQTDHWIAC